MTIKHESDTWEQCEWQRQMDERVRVAMEESARRDREQGAWQVAVWAAGVIVAAGVLTVLGMFIGE